MIHGILLFIIVVVVVLYLFSICNNKSIIIHNIHNLVVFRCVGFSIVVTVLVHHRTNDTGASCLIRAAQIDEAVTPPPTGNV